MTTPLTKGAGEAGRKLLYSSADLDEEAAQAAVLSSLEQRERPLLFERSDAQQQLYNVYGEEGTSSTPAAKKKNILGNILFARLPGRSSSPRALLQSIQDSDAMTDHMTDQRYSEGFQGVGGTDEIPVEQVPSERVTDEQLPLLATTTNTAQQGEPYGAGASQAQGTRKVQRHMKYCLQVGNRLCKLLLSAYFLWMALPLFAASWVLYYNFDNKKFDFMPGEATLSWWFNFAGRQLITLQLAYVVQWLVLDCIMLGSKFTVRLLGPFFTLFALQAKGWPFVISAWSVLDLMLLQGDNDFQLHWFYWTGLKIYSSASSGRYILTSGFYLRVLLSMWMMGVAVSVKRAFVAVHFGRRIFAEFQPRLQKILKDICLLSEVAELAAEAEHIQSSGSTAEKPYLPSKQKPGLGSKLVSVKGHHSDDPLSPGGRDSTMDDEEDDEGKEPAEDAAATKDAKPPLSVSRSGSLQIKALLDRWDEPVNKLDKMSDTSIRDFLKFHIALSHMDEKYPFGEAFGPAATRDECIESAHSVYWRLLKLTPDTDALSNDVLAMITLDKDGREISSKKIALQKLIRPNRYNQIPLLAFIQSCDTLYKKLRYFRASVANATVIDRVLESIIDVLFGFVLFLVVLSILHFNFWPLLVSSLTLIVSFSFALGASASKLIEGILLIVGRRPYDLGDRIVLTGADGAVNPGIGFSWFVEDINLFSTTLRFAATNEVATVSNGSIAGCRIVNCNRSPNAIVGLDLCLCISLVEENKVDAFHQAIQNYVDENPRIWESIVVFRLNDLDADMEQVFCRLAVRHRHSWQDTGRILRDCGELKKAIFNLAESMDVNFDSPPARRLLYSGGILKSGQVEHYKKDLLRPTNIRNYNNVMEKATPGRQETDVASALSGAQLEKL